MLPLISVTLHFAGGPAAGHTDTQFLEAQCVAADPAGVGTTGAVYGMRLRLCTIGLPAWRNRSSIIN